MKSLINRDTWKVGFISTSERTAARRSQEKLEGSMPEPVLCGSERSPSGVNLGPFE